jgi:methyl coenzyme M reductase alpha subunit
MAVMTVDEKILDTIETLSAELDGKIGERDTLNYQIMELEKNIRNLRVMYFKDALIADGKRLTAVGVTEAIRTVLRRIGKPTTPADVKAALNLFGFDLGRFKNPSAAIHNTLLRMAKAGHLRYDKESKTYALPHPDITGR